MGHSGSTIHTNNRSMMSMECKIRTVARLGVMALPPIVSPTQSTVIEVKDRQRRKPTGSASIPPRSGLTSLRSQGHMRRPPCRSSRTSPRGRRRRHQRVRNLTKWKRYDIHSHGIHSEWDVINLRISVEEDGSFEFWVAMCSYTRVGQQRRGSERRKW